MEQLNLKVLACAFPTPAHAYYHIRVKVSGTKTNLKVNRIEGNGKWIRDFVVVHEDKAASSPLIDASYDSAELIIRFDWQNGSQNNLSIALEEEGGSTTTHTLDFTAPDFGGWWDTAWKYYASVVVREQIGLARVNEPVHQLVGVYNDRLDSAKKELRVVEVDSVSGVQREIPSQVYNESRWEEFADEHCQPTYSFDVAFLANVQPYEHKVYLLFYGNPAAQDPNYCTDLYMSGEGLERRIGNAYYEIKLQKESGSIEDIILKQGVNATFCHKLETNGAVQWNPDIYAPPTPWNHISDWDPPAEYALEAGPIFVMMKRWGPMPMYDDVLCSSTYMFYAGNPGIILQSTTELTRDRDVVALRNGEIVLNRELVDEFAWKKTNGEVSTVRISDLPRHPAMGLYMDFKTPWFALFNRERQAAVGVVNVELANIRKDKGLERFDPFQYVQAGPWVYVARPLVYSFVGTNPQRVLRAYGNSISYDKLAWIPHRLDRDEDSMFDWMEIASETLRAPLDTEFTLDTDERVPTEWIPPFLLAEFVEV